MTLVIGIDEAGYGPNLGPLVIGSSSWQIDELQCDHLSTEVADQFIQLQNDIHDDYRAGQGPPWGDSKKIFTRKGMKSETLEPLELACIFCCHTRNGDGQLRFTAHRKMDEGRAFTIMNTVTRAACSF